MSDARTQVVVVGGGTAGWMTAVALATLLPTRCSVRLIESAEIGIVGVGEATLPHLRAFNERIGIDEAHFMSQTNATFKLGIDFRNFGRLGDSYIHPFGTFGRDVEDLPFHHFWIRAHLEGLADDIGDYSLPVVASRLARFAPPPAIGSNEEVQPYGYAYHFDATLFGPYLRKIAEERGVLRTEGKVVSVQQQPESGDVSAVTLESGEVVSADLFVDCSGFRSLLLGHTMQEPWEDWSQWLPCDRAVALPCASVGPLLPYTQAIGMEAGWRWRIPLQHRTGNGYVYASHHISDEDAAAALLKAIDGDALAEPRFLKFKAGRRTRSWVGNVVGVGLASGFLEPLESTSIYLTQVAIQTLIELFPDGIADPVDRAEFNRQVDLEYDRIRDFLILHYHATERDDSPFWDHVRTMEVPASLEEKIELFRRRGRVAKYSYGLFLEPSWVAVLLGQGIIPHGFDQRALAMPSEKLMSALHQLRAEISAAVMAMPDHAEELAVRRAVAA